MHDQPSIAAAVDGEEKQTPGPHTVEGGLVATATSPVVASTATAGATFAQPADGPTQTLKRRDAPRPSATATSGTETSKKPRLGDAGSGGSVADAHNTWHEWIDSTLANGWANKPYYQNVADKTRTVWNLPSGAVVIKQPKSSTRPTNAPPASIEPEEAGRKSFRKQYSVDEIRAKFTSPVRFVQKSTPKQEKARKLTWDNCPRATINLPLLQTDFQVQKSKDVATSNGINHPHVCLHPVVIDGVRVPCLEVLWPNSQSIKGAPNPTLVNRHNATKHPESEAHLLKKATKTASSRAVHQMTLTNSVDPPRSGTSGSDIRGHFQARGVADGFSREEQLGLQAATMRDSASILPQNLFENEAMRRLLTAYAARGSTMKSIAFLSASEYQALGEATMEMVQDCMALEQTARDRRFHKFPHGMIGGDAIALANGSKVQVGEATLGTTSESGEHIVETFIWDIFGVDGGFTHSNVAKATQKSHAAVFGVGSDKRTVFSGDAAEVNEGHKIIQAGGCVISDLMHDHEKVYAYATGDKVHSKKKQDVGAPTHLPLVTKRLNEIVNHFSYGGRCQKLKQTYCKSANCYAATVRQQANGTRLDPQYNNAVLVLRTRRAQYQYTVGEKEAGKIGNSDVQLIWPGASDGKADANEWTDALAMFEGLLNVVRTLHLVSQQSAGSLIAFRVILPMAVGAELKSDTVHVIPWRTATPASKFSPGDKTHRVPVRIDTLPSGSLVELVSLELRERLIANLEEYTGTTTTKLNKTAHPWMLAAALVWDKRTTALFDKYMPALTSEAVDYARNQYQDFCECRLLAKRNERNARAETAANAVATHEARVSAASPNACPSGQGQAVDDANPFGQGPESGAAAGRNDLGPTAESTASQPTPEPTPGLTADSVAGSPAPTVKLSMTMPDLDAMAAMAEAAAVHAGPDDRDAHGEAFDKFWPSWRGLLVNYASALPPNKRGGTAGDSPIDVAMVLFHANYYGICMHLADHADEPMSSLRDSDGKLLYLLQGQDNTKTVAELLGDMPMVAAACTLGTMGTAASERAGSACNDTMGDLNRAMGPKNFRTSAFLRANRKHIAKLRKRHPDIWLTKEAADAQLAAVIQAVLAVPTIDETAVDIAGLF